MTTIIGAAALIAILVWLFGRKRPGAAPAPEDDVETPVDHELLEEAEREVADDPGAKPSKDGFVEDDDDWGPGARP
ncbi:MAG: hypothetical protein ABI647_06690 [Gemmatimonadota bacterium]